ncbi:P-loop NTPase fold protein [Saccharothrix syringae]|uniref:NTPase KAP n=1 Tax=Saccharothrix syringae TaxID=103733 RepID=A0A5Q0H4Y0_SACSY|nr:P-loop NTPase fold protein [Saccharothrix syringae]QFZ21276.1 NTPase KAP [Saccharothrix syringae]
MGVFAGHEGGIRTLAVSADRGRVVTGGEDGTVRLWDLLSGDGLGVLRGPEAPVRAVGVSGDLVVACDEDGVAWSWEAGREAGRRLGVPHRGAVSSAAVAADAGRVVTGSPGGEVVRWDAASKRAEPMPGGRGWVRSLAVGPQAELVVAGVDGGGVHLWRGGDVRVLDLGTVHAVALHGDEVLAGGPGGVVELWGVGGERLAAFPGLTGRVSAVALDAAFAVAGDAGGTVRVWFRAEPGESLALHGHGRAVRAVALVGERLVSAGDDGAILVWDLRRGVQVAGTGFSGPAPSRRLADFAGDVPSPRDLLGFTEDVHGLAALLTDRSTEPPLCVALLGAWGSGKSSFLRQLRDRVDRLAAVSRDNPGRSAFAAEVRQVHFNAWHYNDDRLWVGLVERLFRGLAPDGGDLGAEQRGLRERLRTLEAVRGALEDASLTRLFRLLVSGVDDNVRRARRRTLLLGSVAAGLGLVGAVVGWVLGQGALLAAAASVVAVAAVLTPAIAFFGLVLKPLAGLPALVRGKAEERRAELDREVVQVRERLNQLDAARRLADLVDEARTARYEQYRGLLGRVHEDLRRLNADMAAVRLEWERAGAKGQPPLERVVLYVDDLDRCTPDRVIDVLAAVHLLLALPMFVVVVAVDPHYLRHCLRERGLAPDYLDKIFQVVFALRPMGDGARALVDALVPRVAVTTDAPAGDPVADAPAVTPPDRAPAPPPVATPTADLRPDRLLLRAEEREALHDVAALLGTPRAVKKLVNLYLLVRTGGDDLPHRDVLVLLALLVADPPQARRVFEAVLAGQPAAGAASPGWAHHLDGDPASYREWVGTVSRFGFETHDLVAPRRG